MPPIRRIEALVGLEPGPSREGGALARTMLWVGFVRVALITAGLGLSAWASSFFNPSDQSGLLDWPFFIIGLAYALGIVGVFSIRSGTLLRAMAYAQLCVDGVLVTTVVAMTGGSESVFVFAYVLVVLEGSVLLLRPGGSAAMALCTLGYGGVVVHQIAHLVPGTVDRLPSMVFAFVIHTIGVGIVAVLASGLATQLRIAGRRLAEREQDFERLSELQAAILGALPAGLVTVGPDAEIRFGNASAHTLLHLQPGELRGLKLQAVLPEIAAVLEGERGATLPPGRGPSRGRHEASTRLKDGTEIRIGFSLAPLALDEGPSTIVVFQDVTEVIRLEKAVERAERLAVVGRFAAGLAHEVRNPLASMCASIEVLESALSPPAPLDRLMGNVVREAGRLNRLIEDFLALARPRKLSISQVELEPLLRGLVDMFAHEELMEGIEVRVRCEPGLTAAADPDLLRQVLWNVVRNAAEAMRSASDHGILELESTSGPEGPSIEVLDDGPGLSADVEARAFDPFYTTKAQGSGLGLAISQSIMQAIGGELELLRRPEGGTRARLGLRSSSEPHLELALGSPREGAPAISITELVAEGPRTGAD